MSSFHSEDARHRWPGKHGIIPHLFSSLHHFPQQRGHVQSRTCPNSEARPRRAESPALLCWPALAPSCCSAPSSRALLSKDKATFMHASISHHVHFWDLGSATRRWRLLSTPSALSGRRMSGGGEEGPDKVQSSKNS